MKQTAHLIVMSAILLLGNIEANSQSSDANIFGDVQSEGEHVPFVNIYIKDTKFGTMTDHTGHYMLTNLPVGQHTLVAQMLGFITQEREINMEAGKTIEINFDLPVSSFSMEQIVVTATRTSKRRSDAPVMVGIIDPKLMNRTNSNTVAEGLNFQPGLRVEVDCQTCNYTQLRMNGLGGSYSQILINNQPVFNALNGLYGLEQIPANMIEQVEVVRGGGSVLDSSSAIAGTVNIITQTPKQSSYQLSYNRSSIAGAASDNILNGNISAVNERSNAGLTIFASNRNREAYDHNDDGFSEMPRLRNNSFGLTTFYRPDYKSRLEVSLFSIYEDRRGGNKLDDAPHKADQSEDRTHNVLVGGIQYQVKLDDEKTSLNFYLSGQNTIRDHYTGIDHQDGYGSTSSNTAIAGIQANYLADKFPGVSNNFTLGSEYNYDDIYDVIEGYNYLVDQTSRQTGIFAQSDWSITQKLSTLLGVRANIHNLVDYLVLTPRLSLMYKPSGASQLRLSYSTGFRAPQAFDADMHIAFSGGGISYVELDPGLKEERSQSISSSFNYDKATEHYIYGFTLEGFYTRLEDAFTLEETGIDSLGNTILTKRNGNQSLVMGTTLELRANYDGKIQLQTGITLQKSSFDEAVEWSANIPGTKDYLRTPGSYGYYTFTYIPKEALTLSLSGIYTGSMKVPHYAGATGVNQDVLFTSPSFLENNIKIAYVHTIKDIYQDLEFFGGIQNIFNQYQDDFDTGRYRDSGYIYGPARPRTFFIGLRFGNIL